MKHMLQTLMVGAVVSGAVGCVGYDRLLFVTKTNVGLDVDSKPPTAEFTVARREGVIAPSYEEGKTPALLASFQKEGGFFDPRISAIFSGGDAAVVVSTLFAGDTPNAGDQTDYDGSLCLAAEPTARPWYQFWKPKDSVLRAGEARPFYFGTDTTYGLKVAWSGMTSAIPDTVKLGYNRKEFALAPLSGSERACRLPHEAAGTPGTGKFVIHVPSFVASIDTSTKLRTPTNSELDYTQFFAAGSAATALAKQKEVRSVIAKRIEASSDAVTGAATRAANRSSMQPAMAAFRAGTPENKARIRAKAAALDLVPADAPDAAFVGLLASKEGDADASAKLEDLNAFVMQLD